MSVIKWAAIIAAAWIGVHLLSKAWDGGAADLGGGSILGRGWAAPITTARGVSAWAPPYGVPHIGGAQ